MYLEPPKLLQTRQAGSQKKIAKILGGGRGAHKKKLSLGALGLTRSLLISLGLIVLPFYGYSFIKKKQFEDCNLFNDIKTTSDKTAMYNIFFITRRFLISYVIIMIDSNPIL